jgi:uncharacterized protein YydD (DUF2326 family)
MAKFANILGFLGLGSDKEAVTEAHLQAADDKIAKLEQDKQAADLKAEQAAQSLKVAQDEKAQTAEQLKAAEEKAATLQSWKDNQASVDNRESDDSNALDDKPEAKAAWETAASAAVDTVKRRLGVK